MKWNIREVEIPNQVVLAPMAGVCNSAFRKTVKEFGAGLIYAEMVSDKALLHRNQKTLEMLFVDPAEKPLSMQIFGGDKETLVESAKLVDKSCDCDIIDINMGCPVPKVVKSEAGSKLLLYPDKIYDIVSSVVDAVDKPVTVKIRSGWDKEHIYAVEIAEKLEKAGVSAIAIHGRTRSQMYEGVADWNIIKEVKNAVKVPVIGNGDVKSALDAKRMLDETGVDAVMIGRAAMGNPWIMYQTVKYLESGILPVEPSPEEKIDICKLHMQRLIDLKGEKLAILEMRSHATWYLKGLKGASKVKNLITHAKTKEELEGILADYLGYLHGDKSKIITQL